MKPQEIHVPPGMPWVALLAATALMLGGCTPPREIERMSHASHAALAQSDRALKQASSLSRAMHNRSQATDRRLKAMAEDQSLLERRLDALDRRLAHGRREPVNKAPVSSGFLQRLAMRARKAAGRPYVKPAGIPRGLMALGYRRYAKIRFTGSVPDWSAMASFQPSFQPAGYLFHHAVRLYLLESGREKPLLFPGKDFNFDAATRKAISGSTPLAGFSLYYPFRDSGMDEFLSFQGASYFRAIGKGQAWGLSARGVAINTAVSHLAEEFPYYRAFWIVPPEPGDRSMTLYARLDSPSLTGACRFVIHPGAQTVMDVRMELFARKRVKRLGIAPLTSMFLQGGGGKHFDALHRAVHDSDGLSVESATGAWRWYPLQNPRHLVVRKLPFHGIGGFGLMQRARRYRDYLAYGMDYQKRPSAWVTPTGGDWGKGHVVLVELPTDNETNDNITAFWVPRHRLDKGQSTTFSYRIAWQGDTQTLPPLGHVSDTRHAHRSGTETYVVDFRGKDLDALPSWIRLKPRVRIDGPASLASAWVVKDPSSGRWRLEMKVKRTGAGPVRLRATLRYRARTLTEVWDARLPGKT